MKTNNLGKILNQINMAKNIVNGRLTSGGDIHIGDGNYSSSSNLNKLQIFINGEFEFEVEQGKEVNIIVKGSVKSVETDNGNVAIEGNCKEVRTSNGSVTCKDIKGDCKTTNGNVRAVNIKGKVSTVNGNIRG